MGRRSRDPDLRSPDGMSVRYGRRQDRTSNDRRRSAFGVVFERGLKRNGCLQKSQVPSEIVPGVASSKFKYNDDDRAVRQHSTVEIRSWKSALSMATATASLCIGIANH